MDYTRRRRLSGNDDFSTVDVGPKELPTAPTVEYQGDCLIYQLEITNPTNGSVVVSASDLNGITIIPPENLPPGGMLSGTWGRGRKTSGGVRWQAGASGIHGYIHLIALQPTNQ